MNMGYSMLSAVLAQTTDVFAFVFVSVLGACDGAKRAALVET